MYRFEDRGVTLRLFRDADDTRSAGNTEPTAYACGFIAKNSAGRWIDAHGQLPIDWTPLAKHLSSKEKNPIRYFSDEDGVTRDTTKAPEGCEFHFSKKPTHEEVWIVVSKTGEVIEEYVAWPSLEEIEQAGANVSTYKPNTPS